MPLPAEERRDKGMLLMKAIDRPVLPKPIYACPDHFTLPIFIFLNGKAGNKPGSADIEPSNREMIKFWNVKTLLFDICIKIFKRGGLLTL